MSFPTLGQHISVKGETGVVKYVGLTKFSSGTWIGIELDSSLGKNDGSVNGVRYFQCDKSHDNYGIFVRPAFLGLTDPSTSPANPSTTPSSTPSPQVSDLHRVIDKLQFKLKNTTEDIKEYKQTVDLLKQELSQVQITNSKLDSNLEMLSIDKDYLQSQNDDLEQKLSNLNIKYDELKTDYDIIQEELAINKQLEDAIKSQVEDTNDDSKSISHHDFQLVVVRNQQLETALQNLHKLHQDSKDSLEQQISSLQKQSQSDQSNLQNYKNLSDELELARSTIDSLQSQLDSALESEKIIEHLTSENDQLQTTINQLNQTVNELTEIHELDKSLEESQAQIEQNLKSDIQSLSTIIHNDKLMMQDLERKNKYLESKFAEFKNSATSFPSTPLSSDHHEANELNQQLEKLQLEIKKYRSSSVADKISLQLAQTKLDLLSKFDSNSISSNLNLKNGYEVLFNINLNVAYTSIMLNYLDSAPNSDYQLSNLINLKYSLKLLFTFLQSVAHLWEYNYANKHYVDIIPSLKNLLLSLNENLTGSINHLKEGDIDNTPGSYLVTFISDCYSLLKLNYVNDTYSIIFQNLSLFKISVLAVWHGSTEAVNLARYVLNFLERYLPQQDSEQPDAALMQELHSKFQSIFDMSCSIIEEAHSLSTLLDDASCKSQDITISVKSKIVTIEEVIQPLQNLSKIVKKLEFEQYSINDDQDDSGITSDDINLYKDIFEFDNEVESWGTLDSIVDNLKMSQAFLTNTTYTPYEKQAQSIYDAVNDISANSPPPENSHDLKHKRSIELKYSDLTNKLMEKDSKIQDLQLNVKLLEKNMASTDAKSKEYIEKVKGEMATLKHDHEIMKKNYDGLLRANKELELEIQEVLKSSQVFETSQLMNKFEDLQSQKKFTDEMALIEEVLLLRKMVGMKYNQFNNHHDGASSISTSSTSATSVMSANSADKDDLKWLEQPILSSSPPPPKPRPQSQPSMIPTPTTTPTPNPAPTFKQPLEKAHSFHKTATKLRNLAQESQPVQVPSRPGSWRPKVNVSKYVNALIEEKRKEYQHSRTSSISSSFN